MWIGEFAAPFSSLKMIWRRWDHRRVLLCGQQTTRSTSTRRLSNTRMRSAAKSGLVQVASGNWKFSGSRLISARWNGRHVRRFSQKIPHPADNPLGLFLACSATHTAPHGPTLHRSQPPASALKASHALDLTARNPPASTFPTTMPHPQVDSVRRLPSLSTRAKGLSGAPRPGRRFTTSPSLATLPRNAFFSATSTASLFLFVSACFCDPATKFCPALHYPLFQFPADLQGCKTSPLFKLIYDRGGNRSSRLRKNSTNVPGHFFDGLAKLWGYWMNQTRIARETFGEFFLQIAKIRFASRDRR